MTTPKGPATQSSGNPGGFLNVGWSGTNQTAVVGPAGSLVPFGGAGGIALYDGINSITSGTAVFSNANGVSFGFNGQTITGSVVPGGSNVAISAGANSQNTGTVVFSNANGISFGLDNAGNLTATVQPGAAAGIAAIQLPNTTYTSGTFQFFNSNNFTFLSTTGQGVVGSFSQSVQTQASGAIAGTGFTSTTTAGAVLVWRG